MTLKHFLKDPALSKAYLARALGKLIAIASNSTALGPNLSIIRPEKTNLGAVVVTYHPNHKLRDAINKLLSHVSKVIIVDNGSNEEEIKFLKSLQNSQVSSSIK